MFGLFDSGDEETKYAVVINAGPDDMAAALNGFEYARDFDNQDHHVEIYLDGMATKWPGDVTKNPDTPVADVFDDVAERGLIEGACGACAAAFDAAEECRRAGVDVASEGHAPTMGKLADENYQFITVG